MGAGPIQRAPILKDRQLVLTAMEKTVASLYRLVGVVYLSPGAYGARRQRKDEQSDETHAPSFSLSIGEFAWLGSRVLTVRLFGPGPKLEEFPAVGHDLFGVGNPHDEPFEVDQT
jgi:hypothetical protein